MMACMTDPDDPRLRLRLYIDHKLVDETWLDASNPDSNPIFAKTLLRHQQLVEQAEADGKVWMTEAFDPAQPTEQAYTRAGTDTDGMIDPRPLR